MLTLNAYYPLPIKETEIFWDYSLHGRAMMDCGMITCLILGRGQQFLMNGSPTRTKALILFPRLRRIHVTVTPNGKGEVVHSKVRR
jgi:hypothetical protein